MNPAAESLITSLGFDLDDFKALMRQDINRFQLLLLIATKIDVSDVDPADTKALLGQDLTETDLLCLIAVKVGSGSIGSQLAAPAGIAVTPTNLSFDVSFSAVTGAASYEWRLDGVGSWTNIGTATTFSSTGSAGSHTVKVRAIDGSAVAGHTGTSASFTLTAVAAPAFSVNPVATSSGDLANPVVGDILHSTSGTASGSPSFAYRWRHVSDNSNAAGTGNATANYTAAVADESDQLYCHVTATNSGGSATANSNSSGTVIALTGSPADMVLDFSLTTTGAATTAKMSASEIGSASGSWSYARGATSLSTATIELFTVSRFWPLGCAGSNHQGVTKVLQYSLAGDDTAWEGMMRTLSAVGSVTITTLIYLGAVSGGSGDTGLDFLALYDNSGSYAVAQQRAIPDIGLATNAHGSASSVTTRGRYVHQAAGWYIATVHFDIPNQIAEVLIIDNSTGAVVNVSQASASLTGILSFALQSYLTFAGGVQKYALTAVNLSGTWPLDPITLPAPTSVSAAQLASNQSTVTWSGVTQIYKIERSSNSGSTWTTLSASFDTVTDTGYGTSALTYIDTTVSNGSTYIYRVTALGATLSSSASSSSSPLLIDNGAFVGTPYITGYSGGTPYNGYSTWFGYSVDLNVPITVKALGRVCVGTGAQVHGLRVEDSDGTVLYTTSVDMTGHTDGQEVYVTIPDLNLVPGHRYHFMQEEFADGDSFLAGNTITHTDVGITYTPLPDNSFNGLAHGPVLFKYAL